MKRYMLLICGIPGVGKSTFCAYLAEKFGFAHYNIENQQNGWPIPELRDTLMRSRKDFITGLRDHHQKVIIDWGFPPHVLKWILELQAGGVHIIWFEADIAAARTIFTRRGTVDTQLFERQINAIQRSGLPQSLNATVVEALTKNGEVRTAEDIAKEISIS